MTLSRIRQIYYKPSQIGLLDNEWIPYYNNSGVTPFFENNVFKDLYLDGDHKECDYYGIFSPKFFNKHRKTGSDINRGIAKNSNSDVYSFFGGNKLLNHSEKLNTFYDTYHPHLLEIGTALISKIFNKDLSKIKADRIYYNHWVAKSEVFDGYCEEMLLPAMDLLNGELKESVWRDAEYKPFRNVSGEVSAIMSPEACSKAWGLPYYTHHAFILERLPSIYFALKGLKTTHI